MSQQQLATPHAARDEDPDDPHAHTVSAENNTNNVIVYNHDNLAIPNTTTSLTGIPRHTSHLKNAMANHDGGARPKEQRKRKNSSNDKVCKKHSHHKHGDKTSGIKSSGGKTTAPRTPATTTPVITTSRNAGAKTNEPPTHAKYTSNYADVMKVQGLPIPTKQPGIAAALAAAKPAQTEPTTITKSDTQVSDAEEDSTMLANNLAQTHLEPDSGTEALSMSLDETHITHPSEIRAKNIAAIINEKHNKDSVHIDTPRPPPGLAIPHVDHPNKRATDMALYMQSPLATSSDHSGTASYSQSLQLGGPQYPAIPHPSPLDPIPKYYHNKGRQIGTTSTQTSSHPLTFQNTPEEAEPAFHILPEAVGIWRQSRGYFVTAEKCRVRADKLRDWAEEGLVIPWAVGVSRTPYHYLPKDPKVITYLGEKLTLQALQVMKTHAYGVQTEADLKTTQAHALYTSLEAMYGEDPEELLKLTQIIGRMVAKDRQLATTQANKTEAEMRAHPLTPADVYKLRYPSSAPSNETTPTRGRRRRSKSTSRSPRQQAPQKRRRDRSRSNKNRYRSNVRPQPNQAHKSADAKLFSRFQDFLKKDRK